MSRLVGTTSTPLESVEGLGEGLVEKLTAAGVTSVEALADMTPEQLEAIEGIGPKTVEKISLAVNNYFATLDGAEAVPVEEGEAVSGESLGAEGSENVETAAEATEEVPAAEGAEILGAENENLPENEPETVTSPEDSESQPDGEHEAAKDHSSEN
jgi:N utilization substance protein A